MCKSKKKLLRSQQKFKSKRHNVFTEKVNNQDCNQDCNHFIK